MSTKIDPMNGNKRLKIAVLASGRKQTEIAASSGISYNRFNQLVNGYYRPNQNEKIKIAAELNLPIDELFPKNHFQELYIANNKYKLVT